MRSFKLAVVTATVIVEELPEPEPEPVESDAALTERYSVEQYPSSPEAVRTLTHPFDGFSSTLTIAPFGMVVRIVALVPAA